MKALPLGNAPGAAPLNFSWPYPRLMIPPALHTFATELLHALAQAPTLQTVPLERRVVLDTHVLMECFFWRDAKVAPLREGLCSGDFVAILARDTFLELSGVLSRPQFGATEETIREILQGVRQCGALVAESELEAVALKVRCRDPEDQKFLVVAAASHARALLTRDRLLFKAAKKLRPLGIEPLSPEAFCQTYCQKA